MSTRPFAYTPGANVPGTDKVGDISYGHPTSGFEESEFEWWNGPDEELGYIIAKSILDDSQPTPISGVTASVGFNRSTAKTEASFIELVNNVFDQTFIDGDSAKNWLTANGHWTSYGLDINFVTGIQTYSILYNMEDETSQWAIINFDYTNNTMSLNPLGFSSNEWYREDNYPLNESGYMRIFRNNDTDEYKVLFLDAASNIIQTVHYSGSINYDVLDGKMAIVRYDGGISYFDGLNVYQYTHPTEDLNYTEIVWDADATSSNGMFMYKIVFNDGSVVIEMLHVGTALTVAEYNNLIENYEIKLYDQADYYVISKLLSNNVYEKFEIRKISDNSLLHLVDLTGFFKADESIMEYRHINFNNYGTNKFIMVVHNWDDSDVDYRVYIYNGTTDVLNSTSHIRGVNYPTFNVIANGNSDGISDIGRDSALVSFSSNSGWNGTMNMYAYFDIVYQMSWQTNLNEYVFTNTGVGNEIGISFGYDGFTNNYYTMCTTNNIDLQVLSITEADGLNITTIGLLTDFHNPYLRSFGNKSCLVAHITSDGTGMILKHFGNTATVKDSLIVTGTLQWSTQTFNAWDIFGIKHENILYHINTVTDAIVTIGPWYGDDDFTASSYYEVDSSQRKTNTTLLFNSFTHEAIILKPTTYVTGTLPTSSDNNIRMGKNSFMYIFEDPNSGNIQIDLYDFNLTLLNSIVTDKTNFNFSSRGVKDRFMTRHSNNDGVYTWFMITPTYSNSVMTPSSNTSRIENDWIYWN